MNKINTRVLKINKDNPEIEKIEQAAKILKKGGTVAFPTETVYGLGANALEKKAIRKIFKAKGRPQDNPLIVHIAEVEQIHDLVEEVSDKAYKLMDKFWPGPLTLIFKKDKKVPKEITAGLSTVAIRMPKHNIAKELIKKANLPVAAPSANLSGKPSPTEASHVIDDLSGKIDMIIDGGSTGLGLESTVLDISGDAPEILRPGGVTLEDLKTVFSKINYDISYKEKNNTPKSPGQKYKHYSPKARIKIIQGNIDDVSNKINDLIQEYKKNDIKIGVLATEQTKNKYKEVDIIVVGDREKPQTIATNLFKALREFDNKDVDIILAEGIEEKGLGVAIMNRMKKAAAEDIIYLT